MKTKRGPHNCLCFLELAVVQKQTKQVSSEPGFLVLLPFELLNSWL
jgi:hypothetical protein